MWFFFSSRGGGDGVDGASRALYGCQFDRAARRLRLGACLCVFRQRETPVAATHEMKTPYQNLRQEQHDVRREAPVILIVDDQSAGHPARL